MHTPRDANWDGAEAVKISDRQFYAQELIRARRAKGLDAIAITDHHDFCFFSHIKEAAANEVEATGNPIPKENQIIVFPSTELHFHYLLAKHYFN